MEQPINDFNIMIDFLKHHINDFAEVLHSSPYYISTKVCPYHDNWFMFKYSQFESDFNNPIVRCSRGSVFEISKDDVRPVCLPFYKFANFGEKGEDIIDWNNAVVQLKIDGELKKLVVDKDGKVYWFTNGGFVEHELVNIGSSIQEECSKNAKTFMDLINVAMENEVNNHETNKTAWIDRLPRNTTLMFELTSPRSKVIIDYPKTQLWFLGARNNETFKEYNRDDFKNRFLLPFDTPPVIDVHDMKTVNEMLSTWNGDKEGVVIVDKSFRRIKIKSDAYRQLKFVKGEGNFSDKAIFKYVLEGSIDDAMVAYPEIVPIVEETKSAIKKYLEDCWNKINEGLEVYKNTDKKTLVEWAKGKHIEDFWIYMLASKADNPSLVNELLIKKLDFETMGKYK